ncbi:hypothetical protein M2T36_25840, partial [Escherichia coli]|uniref:hypothetical protein n=1 Tax=Escherichia coli TaxID=562 RepID=UPI0020103761
TAPARASAAPPGDTHQTPYLRLCRMAAKMPYPAYESSAGSNSGGPRKRSAAGQAVPDSVPVVMPDGGYALSGLPSPHL